MRQMQNVNDFYSSPDVPSQNDVPRQLRRWRAAAFLSAWLILAGFLTLPPLYDKNPQLRASDLALIVVSVLLLTGGFATTALVSVACRSWQYRLDNIFLPSLSSTTLGTFVIAYSFAVSTRYTWSAGSIIGVIVGVISSLIYLSLALLARRKISIGSSKNSSWGSHQLQNLFPHHHHQQQQQGFGTPRIAVTEEAPVEIIPGEVSAEEEMTRQQMLNLLRHREVMGRRPSDGSLRTTYNIEIPQAPRPPREERLAFPQHVEAYYTPLHPPDPAASPVPTRLRAESDTLSIADSVQATPVGTLMGRDRAPSDEGTRSRDERRLEIEHAEERQRSRSREIRRQQIETGNNT